jgi:hypothetical protein
MNQYTDLQVIECNRLHSEEAKSGNNENFAHWTNNLQDILHIDAGDKVSVHGAMINEKGAGQSQALEIKGVGLGFKKTFNFLNVEYGNASDFLATGYDEIKCNASSKDIEIRDDTLTFAQTYYQTSNGHNYMHLPRKWWYKETDNSDQQWSSGDSEDAGLSRYFVNFESDQFSFKSTYQAIDLIEGDTGGEQDERVMKPKNDNSRYTLMMREYSFFSEQSASDGYENIPRFNKGARDPENASYFVYKELKEITLPKGFNAPEFVADEITRQMTKITEEKIHRQGYYDARVPEGFHETPTPFYRTISTESYKPFNVAHLYRDPDPSVNASGFGVIQQSFEEYYVNPTQTKDGWEYLSQYHLIGCDKPEIRIAGEKINEKYNVFGLNTSEGIYGSQLLNEWTSTDKYITLDIAYNKDYCDKFKAFIDAQALYPETWEYFKESDNDYNVGDTIENSRYIHINRWKNASMTITDDEDQAQLGSSYYLGVVSWLTTFRYKSIHSALLPIAYDPEQKDEFYPYDSKLLENNKFSYGCVSCNTAGYVVLKLTENNGGGSALYNELLSFLVGDPLPYPTTIEAGRKLGFDFHFSAPNMKYILPYAGYSYKQTSFESSKSLGDYDLNPIDHWTQSIHQSGFLFVNKLYFGATSPRLNWTGTNFTFSDLHTPLNRGQDVRTKNPSFTDYTDQTNVAGDVVYKINPVEYMIDWTPDRKPYRKDQATHGTQVKINILNENLMPWQIYDSSCGIFLEDFNLTETEWKNTLWDILGFSYKQFNSSTNNRLIKTDNNNINDLKLITTNAEIGSADSKVYVQNGFGAPLFNNMMPMSMQFDGVSYPGTSISVPYYAPIVQKTESNQIVADNLPTRMIRGYYTIRSNILNAQAPFIGGKRNNTTMPIIGICDKINGDGDFYFTQDSSLQFTALKPLRLASITCSIHDPDGSYANCGEQSTILFRVEKNKNVSFNVIQEILQENKGRMPPNL